MRCARCDADNPDGARFCDACGAGLDLRCGACGTSNRAGARFCNQCGTLLAPAPRPADPRPAELGERKQVTVLFADIRGATGLIEAMDPEQAMLWLDPAVGRMRDAVGRFGGVVNREAGDGIMALFGAPVACEDHAVRACLAARAIVEGVGPAELEIRVGLNSGDVVIRSVGNDPSDYDAVGLTAHLAHRMEQLAAPNTVRLTAATARLARGFTEVASLGPVEVKGLAAAVEVFDLISATNRPSWEVRASANTLGAFVGRAPEMTQLTRALARAGMGRGQVVTVLADAGMGKSRLAHEFLRALPAGAWNVLRAAAVSHAVGSPFQLAAILLRAWLGVVPDDARAEVDRKLRQALALLDADPAPDLAALQSVLDLPVDDPAWAALDPVVRRARIVAAIRLAMLREAALHPLVLLIEDLHWVDTASEEALDALAGGLGGARLLMLVTSRPETRPRWSARSYASELHLSPLEAEDAESLLAGLLGGSEELAQLRRQIVDQAEGTPLFIEEISRALLETGVVISEPARHSIATRLAEVKIPETVQSILAARIDRLPGARRRLLHVASVIGKDLPRRVLSAVADLPAEEFEADLDALQVAELLYEVNLPTGVELTFKHALTQTVAYEGMLRSHRRDLHARVFTVSESQAGDRVEEFVERLAEHSFKGELWPPALAYAHRAGHRANARFAWVEATAFFDQALAALEHLSLDGPTIAQAIEVRLGLRVALAATGDLHRIMQCLDEARELAVGVGDQQRVAQIDISRCLTLSILGVLDDAVTAGRHGHALADTLGDPATIVNAGYALAQAHWFDGSFAEAVSVLDRSIAHVRGAMRLRHTGTTGTASVLHLVCLSKTHAMTGDFDAAFASAAEARAIAEETRRPYDMSYSRVAEGFASLIRGDVPQAEQVLLAALQIARSAEIRLLIPSIARYLGRAQALSGRTEAARALLEEVVAQTEAQGLKALRAWCGAALALTHVIEGRAEAGETAAATLALARAHGYRPVAAHALRLLAGAQAGRGELAGAVASLRESIALAGALGMRPERAEGLRDLAALLRRLGDTAEAAAAAEQAQALRRHIGMV